MIPLSASKRKGREYIPPEMMFTDTMIKVCSKCEIYGRVVKANELFSTVFCEKGGGALFVCKNIDLDLPAQYGQAGLGESLCFQ